MSRVLNLYDRTRNATRSRHALAHRGNQYPKVNETWRFCGASNHSPAVNVALPVVLQSNTFFHGSSLVTSSRSAIPRLFLAEPRPKRLVREFSYLYMAYKHINKVFRATDGDRSMIAETLDPTTSASNDGRLRILSMRNWHCGKWDQWIKMPAFNCPEIGSILTRERFMWRIWAHLYLYFTECHVPWVLKYNQYPSGPLLHVLDSRPVCIQLDSPWFLWINPMLWVDKNTSTKLVLEN